MTIRPEDIELPPTVQLDVPLATTEPEFALLQWAQAQVPAISDSAFARARSALDASIATVESPRREW